MKTSSSFSTPITLSVYAVVILVLFFACFSTTDARFVLRANPSNFDEKTTYIDGEYLCDHGCQKNDIMTFSVHSINHTHVTHYIHPTKISLTFYNSSTYEVLVKDASATFNEHKEATLHIPFKKSFAAKSHFRFTGTIVYNDAHYNATTHDHVYAQLKASYNATAVTPNEQSTFYAPLAFGLNPSAEAPSKTVGELIYDDFFSNSYNSHIVLPMNRHRANRVFVRPYGVLSQAHHHNASDLFCSMNSITFLATRLVDDLHHHYYQLDLDQENINDYLPPHVDLHIACYLAHNISSVAVSKGLQYGLTYSFGHATDTNVAVVATAPVINVSHKHFQLVHFGADFYEDYKYILGYYHLKSQYSPYQVSKSKSTWRSHYTYVYTITGAHNAWASASEEYLDFKIQHTASAKVVSCQYAASGVRVDHPTDTAVISHGDIHLTAHGDNEFRSSKFIPHIPASFNANKQYNEHIMFAIDLVLEHDHLPFHPVHDHHTPISSFLTMHKHVKKHSDQPLTEWKNSIAVSFPNGNNWLHTVDSPAAYHAKPTAIHHLTNSTQRAYSLDLHFRSPDTLNLTTLMMILPTGHYLFAGNFTNCTLNGHHVHPYDNMIRPAGHATVPEIAFSVNMHANHSYHFSCHHTGYIVTSLDLSNHTLFNNDVNLLLLGDNDSVNQTLGVDFHTRLAAVDPHDINVLSLPIAFTDHLRPAPGHSWVFYLVVFVVLVALVAGVIFVADKFRYRFPIIDTVLSTAYDIVSTVASKAKALFGKLIPASRSSSQPNSLLGDAPDSSDAYVAPVLDTKASEFLAPPPAAVPKPKKNGKVVNHKKETAPPAFSSVHAQAEQQQNIDNILPFPDEDDGQFRIQ